MLFDIGIEEALAGLDKVPKDDLQANIDSIVQRINALEKTVTAKISILPAFDARMCMEACESHQYRIGQINSSERVMRTTHGTNCLYFLRANRQSSRCQRDWLSCG